MKEIIWIAGASAVGKKTFIDRLLQERSLRERFELWGSVDDVDCKAGDFTETQKRIANSTADHILLKWQFKDKDGVDILEKQYPKTRQRIFILWCSRDQHFRRYANKHIDTIKKNLGREPTHSEQQDWFDYDRKVNNEWLQDFLSRTAARSEMIEVKIIDSGQAGYPALEDIPN